MTQGYELGEQNARSYAERVLHDAQAALRAAVAVVSPENAEADPMDVFPPLSGLRNEAVGLNLSEDQATALRAAAANLGFERPTDRNLTELGLRGAHVVLEGGQPHKIVAEAGLVTDDETAEPSSITFAASPYRRITNEDERASSRNQFGEELATEYDAAKRVAQSLPGFRALEEERVLPLSYDIDDNFQVGQEQTGQFTLIGHVGNAPVIMLRIDREEYGQDGEIKYRKQPRTADVMHIVDAVWAQSGDVVQPIAFVTSATYQASRNVDAATVALQTGRTIGVPTYGTERLARVNGTEVPAPRRLEQLPSELHKTAKQVRLLEAALREGVAQED